jgi:hypothetical protein
MKKSILIISMIVLTFTCFGQSMFFDKGKGEEKMLQAKVQVLLQQLT